MLKLLRIIPIVILVIFTLSSVPVLATDVLLKDSFTTGDNNDYIIQMQSQIAGQTWTASSSYQLSYLEIYMRLVGKTKDIVLNFRTASDGSPSNTNLFSVLLPGSSVSMDNSWVRFNLPAGTVVNIISGSIYWWGLETVADNENGNYYALRFVKGNGYNGGNVINSADGGKTWDSLQYDFLFKIYGEEVAATTTTAPTKTTTQAFSPVTTATTLPTTQTTTGTSTESGPGTLYIILGVVAALIITGGVVIVLTRRKICHWVTELEPKCAEWADEGSNQCSKWADEGTNQCSKWADEGTYQCSKWADEGSYQCTQWADEGSNQCTQWTDEGSNQCTQWADEGSNQCSSWEKCHWYTPWNCIAGFFCSAFYWAANWVCKTTLWVANIVCTFTLWVASWVCKVTLWVANWVCKALFWVANWVCKITLWVANLVCKVWFWVAKWVCKAWCWITKVILICW